MPIYILIVGLLLLIALGAASLLLSYFEHNGGSIATFLAACIIGVIYFLWLCCGFESQIYQGAEYASKQQEYNTITQALTTSTDVVNTDLYTRAIDYNTDLAEWKYQDAHHWFGTWGDTYDWSALPYIELTGE